MFIRASTLNIRGFCVLVLLCSLAGVSLAHADAPEPLLIPVGVPETVNLPDHVVAAQLVRLNQRAMRSPAFSIQLPDGEMIVADRKGEVIGASPGQQTWIGSVREATGEVVVTSRGAHFSAVFEFDGRSFEVSRSIAGRQGLFELVELELGQLPAEDLGGVPDGFGDAGAGTAGSEPLAENVVQDLLVVYNQNACNRFGGSTGNCGQIETNIVNAVAAMNTAYAESGINITSSLVGMALTDYSGTNTSQALSDLRGTTDGQMDEVHALRDQLGADLVAMIHDGDGCGIGYLGSSASTAFTVTNYSCLGGNRTLSHEIGHNQGAHHDRVTAGAGTTSAYNYGYRRCSDGSIDDVGSPYFRTIMSYSCGYSRVGRYSNPNVLYAGVPQGIDPAEVTDPGTQQGGAWNARTLNESANYVAGFRQSASTQPPAAPSGLAANPQGPDSILVTWSDNSIDEDGFVLQTAATNSADDNDWSDIATVGTGSASYTHSGLAPESTHWYRVRAYNGAGSSGYSNTDSATTDALPAEVTDVALADNSINGTVSGTYLDTHEKDGVVQSITETHAGGPKQRRKQSFDHSWDFDVYGGAGGVVVTLNAWVSGSEGAHFWYSTDGGATTTPMFTVDANSPGADQTFMLPGNTSGAVVIGVSDAEQSNGEAVDSVFVDYLLITSYTQPAEPPAPPSGLTVTGWTSSTVDLSAVDNADDEWGLEFWRATSVLADCRTGSSVGTVAGSDTAGGTVTFTDTSAQPGQTYYYWATAFNGGGDSACSGYDQVTTDPAPTLSLDVVTPYKVKGKQRVDLAWTASGAVDVYRDGVTPVATLVINGDGASATDFIDAKGGGSYEYRICLQSDPSQCSAPVMAIF